MSKVRIGLLVLSIFSCISCFQKKVFDSSLTLYLPAQEKIKSLDPIYADDGYSAAQVGQSYETLFQYHYLKRPYVLIPALAEGMPEVSADGLVYVIKLKKGVLFQDDACFQATQTKGREVLAEDFIYSIKRLADPLLASPGWWTLSQKILGLDEWRQEMLEKKVTDYSKGVEGLKAVDPYTLRIHLKKKTNTFLSLLSMSFSSIVPQEAVRFYKEDFATHPVGTGAYRLQEFQQNSKIVWIKNPTFRNEYYPGEGEAKDKELGLLKDLGQLLPFIDRVVVQFFTQQEALWLSFTAGKLDTISIPNDRFNEVITPGKELKKELAQQGIRLIKSSGLDVTHATFNMLDPLVGGNKLLRQAMSLAYDQATFIDLFYNGRAIAAQGPLPPGILGYRGDFQNLFRKYNLSLAKELLVQAGYPGGQGLAPIQYAALADVSGKQMAEYIKKMMGQIGIQMRIESYTWSQLQEVIKNHKAQMWESSWVADYPDAENFLQLFYSKNASPGPNDSNYNNLEYDKTYEEYITLKSSERRIQLIQKMVHLLTEDCPWIFGSHRMNYILVQPWLKNYKASDFNRPLYKYYKIDPKLKKQ